MTALCSCENERSKQAACRLTFIDSGTSTCFLSTGSYCWNITRSYRFSTTTSVLGRYDMPRDLLVGWFRLQQACSHSPGTSRSSVLKWRSRQSCTTKDRASHHMHMPLVIQMHTMMTAYTQTAAATAHERRGHIPRSNAQTQNPATVLAGGQYVQTCPIVMYLRANLQAHRLKQTRQHKKV